MEQAISKSKELQDRLLNFAAETINWVSKLQISNSIISQVTRSVASIGANYSEALNASSKTDFRNKIYIAKKEAAETKYWLQLISRLKFGEENEKLLNECQAILMILQKTVNTINGQRKIKNQ